MRKSCLLSTAVLVALAASAPGSAMVGDVGRCDRGEPSIIVRVTGVKQVAGKLKIAVYGGDRSRWLVHGGKVAKVKLPVTASTMDVCVAVPAAGRYAVAVHHDVNRNGERDRHDGGGYSRNPKVTLLNPKPDFDRAAFAVGRGPSRVNITLLYLRGLTVAPVAG